MKPHAVLSGDMVKSSALQPDQLDRAMGVLQSASEQIATWSPGLETGFARRGGDGWQIAFDEPRWALRATLYCQALLRRLEPGLASRIAVAKGDGVMPPEGPNAAHGPGFTASGRLLETMERTARLAHASGGAEAAAYAMADAIARGWTQAQARALAEMLPPEPRPTQAQAAARLSITRTAVQQSLASAQYPHLKRALDAIEEPS